MRNILKSRRLLKKRFSKLLTDGKALLQFALTSVIEALRTNPGKYNNLLVCNISSLSTSAPTQDSLLSHIEAYKDLILDEAKRLYYGLVKHFTNNIMDNTVSVSSFNSSLSSAFPNPSFQRDMDRMDNSESFRENKGDIAAD